jgi:NTE family protein
MPPKNLNGTSIAHTVFASRASSDSPKGTLRRQRAEFPNPPATWGLTDAGKNDPEQNDPVAALRRCPDQGVFVKKVSLVLGSGGARGLAHIGVIRGLEERGFEIGYIAGTSIGALIGGIYAAGKLQNYTDWVCELRKRDIVSLLDWSFSHGGVLRGERIISVLRDLIGDYDIEELPIGFTAVATEINDKREVWLNRGPLFDAIRASIAIPLVFAPVERDGMLLVDGGLVNPIPIAPTLNDASALTFAVDLNARAESVARVYADDVKVESESAIREAITRFVSNVIARDGQAPPDLAQPGPLEIALRSLDTMQTTISRMKLAAYAPRLIVNIPRNLCTLFEFHRAKELIDFGYRRVNQMLDDAGLDFAKGGRIV